MKKIFSLLLVSALLFGCSSNTEKEEKEDPKIEDKEDPKIEDEKVTDSEIDKNLINFDFSYFSGEYINSKNESITLLKDGTREDPKEKTYEKFSESERKPYSSLEPYFWGLEDEVGLSYMGIIYPIGVEVPNLQTNTEKVRISYGHDFPINEEDVYYKK